MKQAWAQLHAIAALRMLFEDIDTVAPDQQHNSH
jgi:hypothetical protein